MMSFPLNRCSECSNILLSGTYKPGKEPNTFICKSHQNTQKAPPTQVTSPARYNQPAPTITKSPASPQDTTLTCLGKDSGQSKLGLQRVSKNENTSTLTPAHITSPTPAPRYKPTSSISVAAAVKAPTGQKLPTEVPKGPSTSVLRNQEARHR